MTKIEIEMTISSRVGSHKEGWSKSRREILEEKKKKWYKSILITHISTQLFLQHSLYHLQKEKQKLKKRFSLVQISLVT